MDKKNHHSGESASEEDIFLKLDSLSESLQQIKTELTDQSKAQSTMQEMYDRLYDELEFYKQDFLDRQLYQPLFRDLILLYDNIEKRQRESSRKETKGELDFVRVDLLSVLNRLEVEPYYLALAEQPTKVNLKLHKIVKVLPAKKAEEHMDIVEVVKEGFLWKFKPLRPAHVVAKKFY